MISQCTYPRACGNANERAQAQCGRTPRVRTVRRCGFEAVSRQESQRRGRSGGASWAAHTLQSIFFEIVDADANRSWPVLSP